MKYLVAVSGGVDSVVLLDMLVKRGGHSVLVAHFDHGIRQESGEDARFVKGLAERYSLPYFSIREELGKGTSEEQARKRRYTFLRKIAKEQEAMLVTAHHTDDLVETIAINCLRSESWRGLAVLAAEDIERPLLGMTKQEIYDYALRHRLEWVEDHTNTSDEYLRNRVRKKLSGSITDTTRQRLLILWKRQMELKDAINQEDKRLIVSSNWSRYFYTMIGFREAVELLRYAVMQKMGKSLLYSQAERGVLAIRVAKPGTAIELGEGVTLEFSREEFIARLS
jgi:tRNA(Ile)-lysidine synthetase-like protein